MIQLKHKKNLILVPGILLIFCGLFCSSAVEAARIKDLASIKGIRPNQLVGYGLVVGLNGTGDKTGSSFTMQSLANLMSKMGVSVNKSDLNVKNVAAVMVTANMPPFARIGSKLDIMISSVGDAKSLLGGTLLLTPLKGVDGKIYALAQGPIAFGGGGGAAPSTNHPLAARVPGSATVEREIKMRLNGKEFLTMSLYNPDFTTILRVADTINATMGQNVAKAIDSGALRLTIPTKMQENVPRFISEIETLEVVPDMKARVVLNEKTGTVVIGDNVTLSSVAIAHGNLSITVNPGTPAQARENVMMVPGGSTIGDLVKALNALGVTSGDLISIFQNLKAAGALQADLEII